MAISDRTRKILWAGAGGRCSKCRVLLVTEGTDTDEPAVIGEEAHIIAEAAGGPRHSYLPDYDCYENLILLCRNDHKPADDQFNHYTVEELQRMKREHETWVGQRQPLVISQFQRHQFRTRHPPSLPTNKELMTQNTRW